MKDKKVKSKKKVIDWDEAHRRMEAARSAVERGFQPSEEERLDILRERAKRLAVEPEIEGRAEYIEAVEFLLAHERYAVTSQYVREICPLNEFTPIPGTPPFVLGMMNLRGRILSIIDIKRFFDLPEKGLSDLNKVIILHSGDMEFGVLADSIIGVRNITVSEMETSLPTLTGIREEYLMGVTRDRTVVLDAGRLLSDPNIIVNEAVDA